MLSASRVWSRAGGPFSETLRKGLNTVFLGATISVGSSGRSGHPLAEDSLRSQDGSSHLHRTEEKHPGIRMGPNTSSPGTMTDGRWYTGIPALSLLRELSGVCVLYRVQQVPMGQLHVAQQ